MFKLCPFCQQQVPVYEWAVHEMQHRGQPPSPSLGHARTGPAQVPVQQAAAKAPRIYHHPRCGRATALPEAAVYAQLQDPFCTSDQAYCSGCQGYVGTSELFWEGTSESLLAYDRRQKAEYIRAHALNPNDFVWDATGPSRRRSQSNWGAIIGVCLGGVALVFLLGIGLIVALVVRSHRQAAAAPQPFAPAVQPAVAPVIPQRMVREPFAQPNGLEEMRARQDDIFAEMRKHQEEMRKQLEEARPPDFPAPPGFGPTFAPGGGLGQIPGGDSDPAAEARRAIDEARRESQRIRDELMERSRQRREESQKRMDDLRSRRP